MSIAAIVPVDKMAAANAALEAADTVTGHPGFGPNNFSIPSYTGASVTHGSLHSWDDPDLLAKLLTLDGVIVEDTSNPADPDGPTDPVGATTAQMAAVGSQWGEDAPPLPDTGMTVAGELYSYVTEAGETQLWSCIQAFDRTTYPAPPATYPALIRQARIPGTVDPWRQPIDQFDAYLLLNPFTGAPDQCTHNASLWVVSQADGSGHNVWEPGVFGWTEIAGWPRWAQSVADQNGYSIRDRVTYRGKRYISQINANRFKPLNNPQAWERVL